MEFHYNTKHVIRNHFFIFFNMIASYVLLSLFNAYLARLLGAERFGDFSVLFKVVAFSVPFALLGTEFSTVRFFPQYLSASLFSKALGLLRWTFKQLFFSSLIILAINSIILIAIITMHHTGIKKISEYHPLLLGLWVLPLASFAMLLASYLRALNKASQSYFLQNILYIGALFLLVYVFYYIFASLDMRHLIFFMGASYVVLIIIMLFGVVRHLPYKVRLSKPEYESKLWIRTSLQMLIGSIAFSGLDMIDIIMLEVLGKNDQDVGRLNAVIIITGFLCLFSSAFNIAVQHLISTINSKNLSLFQNLLNKVNILKIIFVLSTFCVILFYGKNILMMFGADFVSAYPALIVASIAFFIDACLSGGTTILFFSGFHNLASNVAIAEILYIFILNIFVIPRYNLMGATVVMSSAIVITAFLRAWWVRRYVSLKVFFV